MGKSPGRKTFLLTNSDWWFTSHMMAFLLGDQTGSPESWMKYFDLVVVDARKPKFFSEGTEMKRIKDINVRTVDSAKVSIDEVGVTGSAVYSGGHHSTLTEMLGAKGPDVMYAGDHLHADVIKCRKLCEWRTLLVVPELAKEISVSSNQGFMVQPMETLERILNTGSSNIDELKRQLWQAVNKFNRGFGHNGSLFRSGNRLSYFGSQVLIWSDIYTSSINNLLAYSLDQRFVARPTHLPHELLEEEKSFSDNNSLKSLGASLEDVEEETMEEVSMTNGHS